MHNKERTRFSGVAVVYGEMSLKLIVWSFLIPFPYQIWPWSGSYQTVQLWGARTFQGAVIKIQNFLRSKAGVTEMESLLVIEREL